MSNPFAPGDRVELVVWRTSHGEARPRHYDADLTGMTGRVVYASGVSHATANGGGYDCAVIVDAFDPCRLDDPVWPWTQPWVSVRCQQLRLLERGACACGRFALCAEHAS